MHFLSFGTVVRLINEGPMLMIVDRGIDVHEQGRFDYLGVFWPRGNLTLKAEGEADSGLFFNQGDIEEVLFIAPLDNESLERSKEELKLAIDDNFPVSYFIKSNNIDHLTSGGQYDDELSTNPLSMYEQPNSDGILPLGTVVSVNATKDPSEIIPFKVMICGYSSANYDNEFSYQIMMYHEGFLYPKRNLFMKTDEILEVEHLGFVNFEVQMMLQSMIGGDE